MILGMVEYRKPRDAASEALIALRLAMGKTQAAFAVEVLKTAVTTIARYETSHRPPGDVLLRLADIANEHGLAELQSKFQLFYLEDAMRNLGSKLVMVPRTGTEPARGFLTMSLSERAIGVARICMRLLNLMNSGQDIPPEIDKAYSSLEEALTKDDSDLVKQIHQTMLAAGTGRLPQAKKNKSSKRGRTTQ
jgi:hypothetical protein